MSKNEEIRRGFLAGKMKGFSFEPPADAWDNISSQIGGRDRRRNLIFILSAAAGLALAMGVGIPLILQQGDDRVAEDTGTIESITGLPNETPQSAQEESTVPEPLNTIVQEEVGSGSLKNNQAGQEPREGRQDRTSKLEEKVIMALDETIDNLEEDQVLIAEDLNMDHRDDEVLTEETKIDNVSDPSEKIPADKTVVNEDSLLKLLLPRDTISENEEEKPRSSGNWQIGASVSPQYSYRDIPGSLDQSSGVNSSESGKLTYAGGIQVNYKPNRRLTIESGVIYNRMGVNIGDYNAFSNRLFTDGFVSIEKDEVSNNVVSISNSMGTVVADDRSMFVNSYSPNESVGDYHQLEPSEFVVENSVVTGFSQSFEFLEIPLNVKYLIIDRGVSVNLIGGLSTSVMVNNTFKASTSNGGQSIGQVTDVNTINYSGNAGFGIVYDLTKNLSLNVEPRFRYYLNSINLSSLPVTRPYTFGLMTGVSYSFK